MSTEDATESGSGPTLSGAWSTTALRAAGLIDPDDGEAVKRPNRRGKATRDRIVAAAAACFTEYGYSRTRISDITVRAGISQGNFYRHFTSLDEVFLAALAPALDDLAHAGGSGDRRQGELASLVAASTRYLHVYARHRHMLRLLREAAAVGTNEGFRALWLNLRQDYIDRTVRWLRRLEQQGVLPDGEDVPMLAEMLGCMTEQVAYVNIGMRPTAPRREELDRIGVALGTAWYRAVPRAERPA